MAANIPSRRVLSSLKRLRGRLPPALPLSGLRIVAIGNDVVVRDGAAQWAAHTGQLLMDFEVASAGGEMIVLARDEPGDGGEAIGADQWFARGVQLESEDPVAAERAYRQAIALAADHADSYVNLGALLCETGRCAQALTLYDEAVKHCPDAALVHFNRAIALEDQGEIEAALASYERCLELDPRFADAHYNAARLHERAGHGQRAVRHYSAYRRLQPS
jgi:tetratricopeptide (TPR) repeat protein